MATGGERHRSVAAAPNSSSSKLKREEHRRTKHDSSFSKWKILIGPTDWENHSLGKEGCERYRVHNLPSSSSPGVYEIGVAVWVNGSGREVGKLDPRRIVVAYLGQAESVRTRLQSYGRGGAHLERKIEKKRSDCIYDNNVAILCERAAANGDSSRGLFVEIFARGYPIVYRWAPLNSKKDAERAESKLLAVFDYPWNKVGNGSRRPNDVLFKIDQISSKPAPSTISALKIFKLIKALTQKPAVGIPIKSMQKIQVQPANNKLNRNVEHDDAYEKNRNLHGRVLKFGRSNPRIVTVSSSSPSSCSDLNPNSNDNNNSSVCGVRLDDEDGSVCMNQPVKGRKRCSEHKGKKKYSGSFREMKQIYMPELTEDSATDVGHHVQAVSNEIECCSSETTLQAAGLELQEEAMYGLGKPISRYLDLEGASSEKIAFVSSNANAAVVDGEKKFLPICGFILYDGSACTLKPVSGRKRCENHKGRRVQRRSTVPLSKIELW